MNFNNNNNINNNNYYINQSSSNGQYSQFQFVPPPKLPFQNNIPSTLKDGFIDKGTTTTSTIFNQNNTQDNYLNSYNYTNITIPKVNNIHSISFNSTNVKLEEIKKDIENNLNNKSQIIKNPYLLNYIEKDKKWFEKWYNNEDKNNVNEMNSFKKVKYLDVINSFLEIYNNIEEMKKIKNQLENKDPKKIEISLSNFNEKINKFNSLEKTISTKLKNLNNVNSISNWKFKKNKIKKKRSHEKKKSKIKELIVEEKSEVDKNKDNHKELEIKDMNYSKDINDKSISNVKEKELFNIDSLIKKQKTDKNLDLIDCQNMIDMIQKLQKIRNIRRSKEVKRQNISFFEDNPEILKIDERIEALSEIIKPIKGKKKKNKTNHNTTNNNNNVKKDKNNYNSNITRNSSLLNTQNEDNINKNFNIPVNKASIAIKKRKIYHFTEKNRKLLKIKSEPYSNIYEYFNNSKLTMKSLIYIRKEWDRYIVKEGGTSIPPHFVKPDPPASIYWAQYLVNENKSKNN